MDRDMVKEMRSHMRAHCASISLKEMAERFNYHPCTVEAILKRETGECFTTLLCNIRMEEAARILREERIAVQEAAFRCGYRHMSSFYKRFKVRYGVTPGAYARNCRRGEAPGRSEG